MKKLLTFIITFGLMVAGTATASLWSHWGEENFIPCNEERYALAEQYGIENYDCSEEKNEELEVELMAEELLNEGNILGGTRQTSPFAGATYYLAGSGLSSTATSITLQSLTLPQTGYKIQDSDLSDTFYITLEPGNTKRQEIASCTTLTQNAAGTATLSGCSRGLTPFYPYTASTTLRFSHAGGTQVIFSDAPQLFEQYVSINSTSTISAIHKYSVFPEFNDGTTPTTTNQFATKGYVDNVSQQGAPTSTDTVAGISEEATAIETASTTQFDVNNPHHINSEQATSTPAYSCDSSGTTGALCIPVAENDGKLNQSWLDLTEHIEFSSLVATNASTTAVTSTNAEFTTVSSTNLTLYNVNANQLVDGSDVASTTHSHYANNNYVSSTAYTLTDNATTETTIYSETVPANTLNSGGWVRLKVWAEAYTSNNATTETWRLKYGGTTIATMTVTPENCGGACTNGGWIEGHVISTTSTQSQVGVFEVFLNSLDDMGSGANSGRNYYNKTEGEAGVDSTVAQTISFTRDGNDSNHSLVVKYGILEYNKKD